MFLWEHPSVLLEDYGKIKITSDTLDNVFCEIITNNVNLLNDLYIKFGIKVWLTPIYPIEERKYNYVTRNNKNL